MLQPAVAIKATEKLRSKINQEQNVEFSLIHIYNLYNKNKDTI